MTLRIKTNCPRDCYDGCGIVVEVRENGPHRVLGDPEHPVSRGRLCSKCAIAYNGVWQDASQRLTRPLRRSGPKGAGRFEPISWDEALGEVAARLQQTIDRSGAPSILHTHYSGTLSLLAFLFPNRLFGYLGASEVDPDTICNAAGHAAWHLLFGSSYMGVDPRTVKDSATILVWGANPSHSAPHTHEHWLAEAPAKVIVVDPYRTETAATADLHLQPRPGSDAALAFALLHCLERDGAFDQAFIAAHTIGYGDIQEDIRRATPDWGERMTGVPAADIEAAARLYGAGPALLWCGQGLQRQDGGGNIMRAVGLLPALTGNIGKPGAGFYYLNLTPAFAGIDLDWLAGADIAKGGGKTVSHMELARRLADRDEFEVFFAWNTNPVASAPAQRQLRAALEREDLYTVVCDVFMTDTARYADIVLPAASFLEFDDITFSYFYLHMGAQARVDAPPGEALPNSEIFRRLARALDLDEPALLESDEAMLSAMMAQLDRGLDFEQLKALGHFAISDEVAPWWSDLSFETPSGKIEIASEAAVEMGLPRTPQPGADEPAPDGRLRLLSPASNWRLNDSYANDEHLAEQAGAASVHVSPADATRLGISDGAAVRLSNETGAVTLAARIDDGVLPGTLLSYKGRWPMRESGEVNVNALHTPRSADMGNSTSVHSTTVLLEPA